MDNQENHLVRLEVSSLTKARIWLEWCGIDYITRENEIFIHEKDWEKANADLNPSQLPTKPPPKKRTPNTYKGGRPTLESQGRHIRERISVTISNEAGAHLRDCQGKTENKSQVVDRVILEHKHGIGTTKETK